MLYAIAAALILVLDQGLKYFVTLKISLNDGVITLIPKVISLVNIHNSGMAFGALSEAGFRWCFVVVALAFSIGVAYVIATGKVQKRMTCWLLVLIAAGGLGNAIDRALYGYVVDMFRTDFMEFAIFNVADIFVTVCGILLCISLLLPEKKTAGDPLEPEDAEPRQKEKSGFVLRSKKRVATPPSPEVQERRKKGKLYDTPAPINAEDPFAEFESMEVSAPPITQPEAESSPVSASEEPTSMPVPPTPDSAEALPDELTGITVDDILNELL